MHEALRPLIEARWLEEQPTSAEEISGLLAIARRRLDELEGTLKYADSVFTLAYDAVRCAATVVLRAHGVRAKQARHHEMTFDALHRLAIPDLSDKAWYYNDCRRKRARLEYDSAGDVSNTEAEDLRREAARFVGAVRRWVLSARPELARELKK
ncbi:MAG TPA: SAV_6107 family HEPN domain-containing protein [Gemmatimonadales bacterium]|nr:SAV_6107 family HEPN domain-containing protein [Gemmatimonadales bacterium]